MRKKRATSGLTERDLRLVAWIGEQYAARLDHLQILLDIRRSTVYSIAKQLREAGLVRVEQIVAGHPTWVIPTAAGLAASGLSYRVWKPQLVRLGHISATNDVRLHIEARRPEAMWICERQLLSDIGRGYRRHLPDGALILEGRSVAIEVELSAKRLDRVEANLDALAQRYDAILYYCAPKTIRQLTRLEQSGRWRTLGVRELPRWRDSEWR